MSIIKLTQANIQNLNIICNIINNAKSLRKAQGSTQWQSGYPNIQTIMDDISNGVGYILTLEEEIIGYVALIANYEPAYDKIDQQWKIKNEYLVIHRLALASSHVGKGLSIAFMQEILNYAIQNDFKAIRADTIDDNKAMISIFKKFGFIYRGEIFFESARSAYELIL